MSTPTTALLISGDPAMAEICHKAVASVPGLRLVSVPHTRGAEPHLRHAELALVLVHLAHHDQGVEAARLLKQVTAEGRPVAVIIIGEANLAEEGLRLLQLGVADYLGRPLDLDRLAYLLDSLTLRARYAPAVQSAAPVAYSAVLQAVMDRAFLMAPHDTTVLLGGETGTGKTRLARLMHDRSPRRGEPFVTVNCGALAASVIESELFGHVRGAFTGADRPRQGKLLSAGRGTLLLDDVDALPLASQSKLLRAVEERVFEPVGSNKPQPMRARILAASNQDLAQAIETRKFRADLYYRLNGVQIVLPALREQPESIAPLATKFAADFAARHNRSVPRLSAPVLDLLGRYDWPGNIRELRNVIEQAVALCRDPEIRPQHLTSAVLAGAQRAAPESPAHDPLRPPSAATSAESSTLGQARGDAESTRILEALRRHDNNRVRAAAELGISRMTLYKKIEKYGLRGAQGQSPESWRG